MEQRIIAIAHLQERPFSVMHHEDIDDSRLLQSVVTYGQTRPIVVTQDNQVVDGMRLMRAMRALGREEALVYTISAKTDLEVLKAYLQLNLSHAEIDVLAFAELLNKLQTAELSIATIARITCHEIDEVKDILKLLTFKWSDFERATDETSQLALL